MTFSSNISNVSSERTTLVRLNPAKHISNDLSLASGLYEMDVTGLNIATVERNGTTLTEVSVTPTTNDTYQIDGTTLSIKLASAPDDSTNVMVLSHYIYYTSGKTLFEYSDPLNGTGDVVKWSPRILKTPTVTQTTRNVTSGKVTLSSSVVEVANEDNHFNAYCGIEDSFYNRQARVWLKVDDAYNLLYVGRVSRLSISDKVVVSLVDELEGLNQPALMGVEADVAYTLKTGTFSSIRDADNGNPIPYVFTRSPHGFKDNDTITSYSTGIGINEQCLTIDENKCLQATCINYSRTKTTSSNRVWMIARAASFKELDFGTMTAAISNSNDTYYEGAPTGYEDGHEVEITTSGHNLEVGDNFRLWDGGVSDLYGVVHRVTSTKVFYTMTGDNGHVLPAGPSQDALTGYTYYENRGPALVIVKGGKRYFPVYTRDYYITVVDSTYLRVTFTSNFEANHSLDLLDPDTCQIYYRVSTNSELSHADVVQDLLEAAGLSVDSSSLTQADTDLTANVVMSIPAKGESDYKNYIDYVGKVLRSTLGYIKLKSDSTSYEYVLYDTPSSSDSRNYNLFNNNSIDIDYRDMVNEVVFVNEGNAIRYTSDTTPNSSQTVQSYKSKYLHSISKSVKYEHVLDDITGRSTDIMNVLSNRRATYSYESASVDLAKTIGDEVKLVANLLGTDTSKSVSITSISKSEDKVSIKADDMGEL